MSDEATDLVRVSEAYLAPLERLHNEVAIASASGDKRCAELLRAAGIGSPDTHAALDQKGEQK